MFLFYSYIIYKCKYLLQIHISPSPCRMASQLCQVSSNLEPELYLNDIIPHPNTL